ncbi:MAG: class C sortase [Eubacteriales bacterium]|nr:class C sortase [Eubacteriales bacterium]
MKKHLSTILLVGVFLLGLGILLYPSVSDYWNSMHQTRAIGAYEDTLSGMTQKDYSEYFAQAEAYNAALASLPTPLTGYEVLDTLEEVPKYRDVLDVNGMGIMGYIDIDEIGVELPIYHGTDPSVLNVAVGHLEGTSLPVGGVGTHCVLSAHRGLPSARLFTDLDRLKVGDTFTLTVLNRLLTYQVDQVLIVEPDQVEALAIDPNEDYCTLVTCTPYGINTHRLLVRGRRVENAEEKPVIYVPADMVQIDPLVVTPAVAAPMLLVLLIFLLIRYRKRS